MLLKVKFFIFSNVLPVQFTGTKTIRASKVMGTKILSLQYQMIDLLQKQQVKHTSASQPLTGLMAEYLGIISNKSTLAASLVSGKW